MLGKSAEVKILIQVFRNRHYRSCFPSISRGPCKSVVAFGVEVTREPRLSIAAAFGKQFQQAFRAGFADAALGYQACDQPCRCYIKRIVGSGAAG